MLALLQTNRPNVERTVNQVEGRLEITLDGRS